jgi:hypothetical protein
MQDQTDQGLIFTDADREFQNAWTHPAHTRFELPAVDVNRVLQERYTVDPDFRMTRTQLWDMEVKKAWNPLSFIPYVVSEGASWDRRRGPDDTEHFYRCSMQAAWIGEDRGLVLEEVFIDHTQQRIFFMGRASFPSATGEVLRASDFQPLFHVEHAAEGAEDQPLNIWRIVLLTAEPDPRLQAPFEAIASRGLLPGFVEIYIERDLGVKLRRDQP